MRYIAIEEFCQHHGIEVTVIREFADFGLTQLTVEDNREFVEDTEVKRLERMLRISRDLGVNKEGIDIILNMRQQLQKLRRERENLRYRLLQLEAESRQRLANMPFATNQVIDYADTNSNPINNFNSAPAR
jgi:DNA-binding transcriptional MerR regulator